jgi:uncharacterized protein (TIGR02588 family)
MASKASRRSKQHDRTRAEMITLAISLLLLLGLVGGLVWLELQRGDEPAHVQVLPEFSKVEQHEGAWYLPVTIRNDGDRATDVLRVDLVRPIPGEDPEIAELEYAFVAGDEEVEGMAVFDERPTRDTIEIDVVSVTEP